MGALSCKNAASKSDKGNFYLFFTKRAKPKINVAINEHREYFKYMDTKVAAFDADEFELDILAHPVPKTVRERMVQGESFLDACANVTEESEGTE